MGGARAKWLLVALLAVCLPGWASAQEWLPPNRTTPALWEIIGIDASGEQNWPFYQEDIAGDGLNRFDTLESRMDVRSVYANREGNDRLWFRFYVASATQPPSSMRAYLFIDTDRNHLTGHQASSGTDSQWDFFASDPTEGGYERVIAVQGDGTVLGVWSWDAGATRWFKMPDRNGSVVVESGADNDRLRIGPNPRGYLQFNADVEATGIDNNCDDRFFLRTWNVDPNDPNDAALNFGDTDVAGAILCNPPDDNNDGIPDVIYQTVTACQDDGDCPGTSYCFEQRVCVIGYECAGDPDCRRDEACTNNVCVRVVQTDTCNNDSECAPFICDNNQCATCTTGGARACDAGFVCVPDGRCVVDSTIGVITCTDDPQCGALVCDNNQCVTCTDGGARACATGYACLADGRCSLVPVGEQCTASNQCGALVCDGGQCVRCTDTGARACAAGFVCQGDGTCSENPQGQQCTDNNDCGALVCANGQCVGCNASGAPACTNGQSCAANGLCGGGTTGDTSGGATGEDVIVLEPGERVQGGSCTCDAARRPAAGHQGIVGALGVLGLLCAAGFVGAGWATRHARRTTTNNVDQRAQQGETR